MSHSPVAELGARAAIVSLVVSCFAAPIVYKTLLRLGSRQNVSVHLPEHAAKQGTPTMGGLIVLAGVFAAMAVVGAPSSAWLTVAGFGLVGLLDDFVVPRLRPGSRGLAWAPKLALQAVVAGTVAWSLSPDPLVRAGTGVALLFYANAFNFSDGMDTLSAGIGVLLATGFASLDLLTLVPAGASPGVAPVLLAAVAGLVPFWVLNAPPARVFMGDVGALSLGGLLGWAAVLLAVPSSPGPSAAPLWVPVAVASLVLVAEIVPVPLQIAWVKLFNRRLFSFKTPIHHAFQAAGWPETRVVAMFHAFQAALVILGVSLALLAGVSHRSAVGG